MLPSNVDFQKHDSKGTVKRHDTKPSPRKLTQHDTFRKKEIRWSPSPMKKSRIDAPAGRTPSRTSSISYHPVKEFFPRSSPAELSAETCCNSIRTKGRPPHQVFPQIPMYTVSKIKTVFKKLSFGVITSIIIVAKKGKHPSSY